MQQTPNDTECADTVLPCPFCGSRRTSIQATAADFAVVCESCGGIGPSEAAQDHAVQRWNSRSALAASFRAAVQ